MPGTTMAGLSWLNSTSADWKTLMRTARFRITRVASSIPATSGCEFPPTIFIYFLLKASRNKTRSTKMQLCASKSGKATGPPLLKPRASYFKNRLVDHLSFTTGAQNCKSGTSMASLRETVWFETSREAGYFPADGGFSIKTSASLRRIRAKSQSYQNPTEPFPACNPPANSPSTSLRPCANSERASSTSSS